MLWLLALAGTSLLVWVVLHIAKSLSEQQRAFSELCDAVGARPSGPVATGLRDGIEYHLAYAFEARSHGRPSPTFLIALVGRSRQRFRVVRRDRENLVSKLARGTSTLETGDADLDRTVRITAGAPEAWAGYFAGGERQYALRKLLELGAASVVLDGGRLEA